MRETFEKVLLLLLVCALVLVVIGGTIRIDTLRGHVIALYTAGKIHMSRHDMVDSVTITDFDDGCGDPCGGFAIYTGEDNITMEGNEVWYVEGIDEGTWHAEHRDAIVVSEETRETGGPTSGGRSKEE